MNRREFLWTGSLAGISSGLVAATPAPASISSAVEAQQSATVARSGSADRLAWTMLLGKIADPVLTNLSRGTLQKNWTVEYSPTWDGRNKKVAYLEAFGRLTMGLAPWLALPDDDTAEGTQRKRVASQVRASVAHAVDPLSSDYMLWHETGQTLVDAAYLAQAFLRAPAALWDPLDATTRERVIAEFRGLRRVVPPNNNWLLFMAMVEVFLHANDEGPDQYRIDTALRTIESWYVGDGWYGDGPRLHMDYYNSYVIHSMLVDVVGTQLQVAQRKNQSVTAIKERYDRAVKRMTRFSEFLERMISPEGAYPPFGRSITYRTAIFQALGHAAVLNRLPEGISAAQVRCGISAVMQRMFDAPGVFDKDGWLTLGFAGHQPGVADYYSNSGSMYICALGFAPLGLPASDPFWTAPPEDWTSKKAWVGQPFKKDYAVDY